MAGALLMAGTIADSHLCPCLCTDSLSLSNGVLRGSSDLGLNKKQSKRQAGSLELSSSFTDAWYEWRLSGKGLSTISSRPLMRQRRKRSLVVVDELGGQYEDGFEDVTTQILNYFTYKAVRTVLHQLYELNPPQYRWFYNFLAANKPADGKRFIRTLGKERHELAERVMITRLDLYGKWVKKCDHSKIYKEMSDQNLELLRERLMETVVWPSDDTST